MKNDLNDENSFNGNNGDFNSEELFQDSGCENYEQFDLAIEVPVADEKPMKMPKTLSDIQRIATSVDDLFEIERILAALRAFKGYDFLFRGHSDETYKLRSTIAREQLQNTLREKEVLESFKAICKSNGYEKWRLPFFNENLFYLGIGRHLGLHTRLLDWTASYWIALSFLMKDNREKNGELWILAFDRDVIKPIEEDPFVNDDKVHILKEPYYLPDENNPPVGILRRARQSGFFTVQRKELLDIPLEYLAEQSGFQLIKIYIPKSTKDMLEGCEGLVPIDWLYVDENHPILKEIRELNEITKSEKLVIHAPLRNALRIIQSSLRNWSQRFKKFVTKFSVRR